MHLLPLLATVLLALNSVDARPVKASRMITLPLRRLERDNRLHPEIRHQQHINRATRLVARAGGRLAPSNEELYANLERRASFLEPELRKRFNIPPPNYGVPRNASSGVVSNVAVENDDEDNTSENDVPVIAKHSSQLLIDGPDTTYVVTMQIGTPSRDFNVILDSGSGDFWVMSDECTSEGQGCGNHAFLSEASSSSFVNTNKPWSIQYGSGSASGDVVKDNIVLGGMVIDAHTFGVAHQTSTSFSGDDVADGLMGLSKSSLSTQGVPTPVEALRNVGFFSQAITSYRLPRTVDHTNNGEVTFGGLDETKFDPSTLVTIPSNKDGFWFADLGGASVNGQDVTITSTQALMDTGTTLLVVPEKDAEAIHSQIPGAKQQGSGQYSVPCDTTARVALKFGGKSFEIDPKDLVFASGGRTTGDCTSGIGSYTDDHFLVGDSFLKSVYFSTNVDENTITLAKAV